MITEKIGDLSNNEVVYIFKYSPDVTNSVSSWLGSMGTIRKWKLFDGGFGYAKMKNEFIRFPSGVNAICSAWSSGEIQMFEGPCNGTNLACIGKTKNDFIINFSWNGKQNYVEACCDGLNQMLSILNEDETLTLLGIKIHRNTQISANIKNLHFKIKQLFLVGEGNTSLIILDSKMNLNNLIDVNDYALNGQSGILFLRTLVPKKFIRPSDSYNKKLACRGVIPRELIDYIEENYFRLKPPYEHYTHAYNLEDRRFLFMGNNRQVNTELLKASFKEDIRRFRFFNVDYGVESAASEDDKLKGLIRVFDENTRKAIQCEQQNRLREVQCTLQNTREALRRAQREIEQKEYVLKRNIPIPEIINYSYFDERRAKVKDSASYYIPNNDYDYRLIESLLRPGKKSMILDFNRRRGDE